MGYKLLGFAVWRVGRWYVGRRFANTQRKLAVGVVTALVVGGAVTAGRARSGD